MRNGLLLALFVILIAACSPGTAVPAASTPPRFTQSAPEHTAAAATRTPEPTATPESTATPERTATPDSTATTTPAPSTGLCTPLEDIALSELAGVDLLKSTFAAPPPGYDGGHQGVDFSFWSRGSVQGMQGWPVQSALDGKVAAVLPLRLPYGNAIIIETPLQNLPPAWVSALKLPDAAASLQESYSLNCPAYDGDPSLVNLGSAERSLYILYGHLNEPTTLEVGQNVSCGQAIGKVGTTGNSVNPHLHFETRVGPPGARFDSIGHYAASATEAEMRAYCAWRISGAFELFDPMRLLSLQP